MVWNGGRRSIDWFFGNPQQPLVLGDSDVLAVGRMVSRVLRGQPPVLPENYELHHLSLKRTRNLCPPRAGWFANGSNRSPSACGYGREL